MGKDRNGCTKCFVNEDLPGSIAQAVLAADNMGDAVADVIHHVTEQIERRAVGAHNDKVFNIPVGPLYAAVNLVFKNNRSLSVRHFEADDIRNAFCFSLADFFGRQFQAGPVILIGDLGCHRRLPFFVKVLLGAETFVGMSCFDQLMGGFNMFIDMIGLEIGPFIPIDSQPFQGRQLSRQSNPLVERSTSVSSILKISVAVMFFGIKASCK